VSPWKTIFEMSRRTNRIKKADAYKRRWKARKVA
jgi:hypothetical protein